MKGNYTIVHKRWVDDTFEEIKDGQTVSWVGTGPAYVQHIPHSGQWSVYTLVRNTKKPYTEVTFPPVHCSGLNDALRLASRLNQLDKVYSSIRNESLRGLYQETKDLLEAGDESNINV